MFSDILGAIGGPHSLSSPFHQLLLSLLLLPLP
jgi:hypothetical protein